MTTLVSLFGIVGRFAGDLLMSALGWASSLLFGRVPRSHQIFLVGMMAGSLLWSVAVLSPSYASSRGEPRDLQRNSALTQAATRTPQGALAAG